MSRRRRRIKEQSLRQSVARNKELRRRTRLAKVRPAAAVVGAAALTLAGVGTSLPAAGAAPQEEGARQADSRTASATAPRCGLDR